MRNVFLVVVFAFIAGAGFGVGFSSYHWEKRVIAISENVGAYVKDQQQINAVYEPAVIGFVLETKVNKEK